MIFTIDVISLIIFTLLAFPAITVIISIAKRNSKKKGEIKNPIIHDYGIVITAYKNFGITLPAIESFVKQNFPSNMYHLYVVADDCSDVQNVKNEIVSLLIPNSPLSSKVKSIKFAMNSFVRKHDYIIVMDADNLVAPDYLQNINMLANDEYLAIQGKRTHKNLDTVYSCLDAAGEIYYNYTQRSVPFNLGSSAAISGSGMAVSYNIMHDFMKSIYNQNKLIIAEDKLLQNYLVANKHKIAFSPDAVIYDEKISKGYQTQRQRTRWLSSYFQNLKASSRLIVNGLANKNFNQLFFGVMTSFPPIITLIIASFIISVISLLLGANGIIAIILGWLLFSTNFFYVLWLNNTKREIWRSLLFIPLFAYRQIIALLNLKKANKDFMATEHSKVISLNEVLEGN